MFLSLAALTTEAFSHQGRRKKVWHRFCATGNFSRTPIRVSEKTFSYRKKTKKKKQQQQQQQKTKTKKIFTVFLLSSSHEITGKELKKSV